MQVEAYTHTTHRVVTVHLFNSPVFHLVPAGLSVWQTGVELGWTRASPNILAHHSIKRMVCVGDIMILRAAPKYFTGYFPNEVSFSLLVHVSYPPVLAWELAPPPPETAKARSELRSLLTNPPYGRDSSYSRSQLWSPTDEDKKTLKLLRQPPFSFTSFFVSRLIPRLTAPKIRNVGRWGQWGCGGQWPHMLARCRSQL